MADSSGDRAERLAAWLCVSPALALLWVLLLGPVLAVAAISLTDWQLGRASFSFVGLANYAALVKDPVFWRSLGNTCVYAAVVVPVSVVLGLVLALTIEAGTSLRTWYRAVFFLPVTSTLIAMAVVWEFLLHPSVGLITVGLERLGLPTTDWLKNPATALLTLCALGVWQGVGLNVVLFTAGLKTVPADLYEAADVDGADSAWERFRRVTWPMLGPASMFVTVVTAIRSFQVFDTVEVLHFDWDITGNWMWQALVFSHGGTMLSPDEKAVAFDGPAGQKAIAMLGRMVKDGTMRNVSQATVLQDFVAGRLGIWSHSTSRLGGVAKQVGKTFELRTARFPVYAGRDSRLPAGGNVAMIFARDPARQRAAWDYVKFATGPAGATMMVKATGYFPANALPAKDPALLGDFYKQNPNHQTAIGQLPMLTAWYAFPGEHGLKITDVIKDHLQTVVAQTAAPEPALRAMTNDVKALLPK